MITIISYIALKYFIDEEFNGYLLILPVLLDLTLFERISK